MIRDYYQNEIFEGNNSYFCQKCDKKSTLATRYLKPSKYPEYLMITMHRFYYNVASQKRMKILNYVEIPPELTLTIKNNDLEEELIYDLYAVVVHRVKLLKSCRRD